MPAEMDQPSVETSYKARRVEAWLDLHFYRPFGYRLALFFARIRMSPAQVTLCGGALGITAGHFYYYRDLRWNLLWMFLHVLSNAFDNADGQLARLTKQGSRSGRALDGLVDNLVFVSVYAHLCLRYIAGGGSPLVGLLAIAAGLSHSWQSAAADYVRNAWLYFAEGKSRAELDAASQVHAQFVRLRWKEKPREKFLFRLYLNYTTQQEWLLPRLNALKQLANEPGGAAMAEAYCRATRPLIKWTNLLATNPRMILLFALLLLGQPVWYFVAELTVFNLLLFFLLRGQDQICRRLLATV
ncbi:MAG: CDP-alcohol phosphatidyltransferase family protein [Chthoniobacterales bacterium]